MRIDSNRFVKKSAFRFTSCHVVFLAYLLYSLSQKNKLASLFAECNTLELDVVNLSEIIDTDMEPERKDSTPPGPSDSPSVLGSQQRSTVWSVFAINDKTGKYQCQLCKETVKDCSRTTNLWQHLQRHHKAKFIELNQQDEAKKAAPAKDSEHPKKTGSVTWSNIVFLPEAD